MDIFNEINKLRTTLAIFFIIMVVVAAFVLVYFMFFYKPKPEIRQYEKYENFERKNVESYIPIKWIKDGVMLMEDEITYSTVLLSKGFDFFYAHPREQLETNVGFVEFMQSMNDNVQIRMSNKQEDLEKSIRLYEDEKLSVDRGLIEILDEAVVLEQTYDAVDDDTKEVYAKKLTEYDKIVRNKEWESRHIEQIINYLKEMSDAKAAPVRETCYIISWKYDESEFPEGTTEKDVFERAKKELSNKADTMQALLSSCNVKVKKATDKEIMELTRGHMKPYGNASFKLTDIENSNFDQLVVTSNSLEKAKERYDEFVRKVASYEQRREEIFGRKNEITEERVGV